MFAEKQKLVADLEAFGPGGGGMTSGTTKADSEQEPPITITESPESGPDDKPSELST